DPELVSALRQLRRVGCVVGARARDDGRAIADCIARGGKELELLVVREGRALPRRPCDDEPIRAVIDEELRQLAELLEVHRAVRMERRDDCGQDLAEHRRSVRDALDPGLAPVDRTAAAFEDRSLRATRLFLAVAAAGLSLAVAQGARATGPPTIVLGGDGETAPVFDYAGA